MRSKSLKEIAAEHEELFSSNFKKDYKKLSKNRQLQVDETSKIVDLCVDEMNFQLDESVRIENKFRSAGYLPSEAEEILKIAKNKAVGQCFVFNSKILVKTPFNTVITSDEYLEFLQNQILSVAKLNDKLTNGSFLGLIKLAFKRLIRSK